jgi:ribosomal protein S18 acetylase RimI-like enzyme
MTIRSYEESDEGAVVLLWREVFPDAPPWNDPVQDIRRKLAVQRGLFLVATANTGLVGTAMGGYDGHRGWVYYVAVRPEHRRRGIGTALMKEIEARLIARGCPKLNLQVRGSDEDAIAFYKRLGFAIEERVSMGKLLGYKQSEAQLHA